MSLSKEEIEPGVVAFLETVILSDDPLVSRPGGKAGFRSGPYLCVQVRGGRALWLPLTSRKGTRGLRLELERRWKVDGNDRWQRESSYIQDARRPFIGPVDSFALAAQAAPPDYYPRAYVSDEGLAAVEMEIRKYDVELLTDAPDRPD